MEEYTLNAYCLYIAYILKIHYWSLVLFKVLFIKNCNLSRSLILCHKDHIEKTMSYLEQSLTRRKKMFFIYSAPLTLETKPLTF